jgi:hypothetical protein
LLGFCRAQSFALPRKHDWENTSSLFKAITNKAAKLRLTLDVSCIMRAPKNHISYPRKKILEVLRTLNELVVSLDQLGSAEMSKHEHDAAVSDFIQRHRIFRKTARAEFCPSLFLTSLVQTRWVSWSERCRTSSIGETGDENDDAS